MAWNVRDYPDEPINKDSESIADYIYNILHFEDDDEIRNIIESNNTLNTEYQIYVADECNGVDDSESLVEFAKHVSGRFDDVAGEYWINKGGE